MVYVLRVNRTMVMWRSMFHCFGVQTMLGVNHTVCARSACFCAQTASMQYAKCVTQHAI